MIIYNTYYRNLSRGGMKNKTNGAGGRRNGEWLLNEYGISIVNGKKVLKIVSQHRDCISHHQVVYFKMGKLVKFYVMCILLHQKSLVTSQQYKTKTKQKNLVEGWNEGWIFRQVSAIVFQVRRWECGIRQ